MLRKTLIAIAILVVLVVGVSIYFFYRVDSEMARDAQVVKQKLGPRVITGEGRFEKRSFYTGEGLGDISQILVGWPADREGSALAVVGNEGAHFLNLSGQLKKQVRFSKNVFCPIELARLDASGDYGFLTRDQSWAVDVILFDKQGQERWSYAGGFLYGIDDSVAGDVDGDGMMEVVIGFNGKGGVVLLNGEGKKLWQKPDANVWHVETLDTKGDGRKEILHSNARGQLLVRDASGQEIAHYFPDHYVSEFALTRWGSESQASHILIPFGGGGKSCCKPVFFVLDSGGKTVTQLDAPLGDLMERTQGAPVRYADEAEYYAVLQSRGASERSMLFLYDKKEQVAYQEVLGESCRGIAVLPGKFGDRLLIGCLGKIWEYSPADEGGKPKMKSEGSSPLKRADSQ